MHIQLFNNFRPSKITINHHLPNLDFCWQYCHILLEYNTRITISVTLFLTFFTFSYCFIWIECLQLKSIKCYYRGSWKLTCTKLAHIFVVNSYRSFIFKSKAWKKNLKEKFEIANISVFHCSYFLGTLWFYNKSFTIWEDSKVCK